jgi:hypothetical protein
LWFRYCWEAWFSILCGLMVWLWLSSALWFWFLFDSDVFGCWSAWILVCCYAFPCRLLSDCDSMGTKLVWRGLLLDRRSISVYSLIILWFGFGSGSCFPLLSLAPAWYRFFDLQRVDICERRWSHILLGITWFNKGWCSIADQFRFIVLSSCVLVLDVDRVFFCCVWLLPDSIFLCLQSI